MKTRLNHWLLKTTRIVFLVLICHSSIAQTILNKNLSVNVTRQRLDDVLEIISNKGNFYFSYNSSIIKKDSLVSISQTNKTVKEILDQLFPTGYEYRESGNYLIIRRAPIKLTLVTTKAVTENKFYVVSGYVL
ncbi:MAG TPA: STN domain-containing protein, partial [Flavisolibacter sp.]|nr:STN domain-containing protein [Flavisolibacter sp.]